ncbi:MAG: hypothetical protein ACR2KC_02530 [Acidimicrobiales bacterium]
MRFIARERYGGVRRLRRAIRRELQLVVEELTVDLSQFPVISEWSVDDRRLFAGLVVNHMVSVASELIDATPDEVQEISELAVRQLRLTLLGVANWRSRP